MSIVIGVSGGPYKFLKEIETWKIVVPCLKSLQFQ